MRLIIDQPLTGAENMARDEAMLQTTAARGQATLRLYQWSQPCLSLGYFQKYEDRQQHAASADCSCVRRSSGGGAILHHHELTYSFAIPVKNSVRATSHYYNAFHDSLIQVLQAAGVEAATFENSNAAASAASGGSSPFLCFQRRADVDIVANGAKLVGSAQRRRHGALLQHGSILLEKSAFAPELPGIAEQSAGSQSIGAAQLIEQWLPPLAVQLGCHLTAGGWTEQELTLARQLNREKFTSSTWTQKR